MSFAKDLSVIIPARNEQFLVNTVDDILRNIEADTEIIVVCDGAWPNPPIQDHPRVTVLHFTDPIGQRGAVNVGAQVSRAKYVMKLDAHCAVDKGFDRKLMATCQHDWTVIPRMYHLHVFDWVCVKCQARYYQADPVPVCKCGCSEFTQGLVWQPRWNKGARDFMRFDHTMHFQYWGKYDRRPEAKADICDTMSSIGACFFMERDRFYELGGVDEAHGFWGQFGVEIACKSWLSGGRHVVNKTTWFAHFFRVGKLRFPYEISGDAQERAKVYSRDLWMNNKWDKQVYPLSWLVEKFKPAPDWHDDKGKEALSCIMSKGNEFRKKAA
jgi:glycosyltransferase involved in cell wall biosynthesis